MKTKLSESPKYKMIKSNETVKEGRNDVSVFIIAKERFYKSFIK